jgi:hypothetical protein
MATRKLRSSGGGAASTWTTGGVRGPVNIHEFDDVAVIRLTRAVRRGERVTTFDGERFDATKGALLRTLYPNARLFTADHGIIRGFTVNELAPQFGVGSIVEFTTEGTNARFTTASDGRVWLVATDDLPEHTRLRAQEPVGSNWPRATLDPDAPMWHIDDADRERVAALTIRRESISRWRTDARRRLLQRLLRAPTPSAGAAVKIARIIQNRCDTVQIGLTDTMSLPQFVVLCEALAINTRMTTFRLLGNVHWLPGIDGVRQATLLGDAIAHNGVLQDLNFGENTDGRRGLMSLVKPEGRGTDVSLLEVLFARFEQWNTSVWTMFIEQTPERLRERVTAFLTRNRAHYVPVADGGFEYRDPATGRLTGRVKIESDHSGRWLTDTASETESTTWWVDRTQCRVFDCADDAVPGYFLCPEHTCEHAHVDLLHPPVATGEIAGSPETPLAIVPLEVFIRYGGSADTVQKAVLQRARLLSEASFDVYIPAGVTFVAAVRVLRAGDFIE